MSFGFKKYYLYLSAIFLKPIIVTLSSLSIIIWASQVMRFSELISGSGAAVFTMFKISIFLLPYILFISWPPAFLVSTIYLSIRLQKNELAVLYSFGLKYTQLMKPLLALIGVFAVLHYMISFYIMPISQSHFFRLQNMLSNQHMIKLIKEKNMITRVPGILLYVDKKLSHNRFMSLFIDDSRVPGQHSTITAKTAELDFNDGRILKLALQDGSHLQTDAKTQKTSLLFFQQYELQLNLEGNPKEHSKKDSINAYSINELIAECKRCADFDSCRQLRSQKHHRITWPLFSISLPIMVIVGCIGQRELHRVYEKKSQWIALTAGFLIMFCYFFAQNLLLKWDRGYYLLYFIVLVPCFALAYRKAK